MDEHEPADEASLHRLADALSRYTGTKMETREVERTEEVEREILGEQTVTTTEEQEAGPHPGGYVVLFGGLVIGGVLALLVGVWVGMAVGLAGGIAGGMALYWWRTTEEKTVEQTEELPTTIVEEVTRTETVEEEVPDDRKIHRAGRGTLTFVATESPDGSLVKGPDEVTTTKTLDVPTIERPSLVYDVTESIEEEIGELPWVLDGAVAGYDTTAREEVADYEEDVPLRGEERSLRDYVRDVEDAFADLTETPIEVKVLKEPELFDQLAPELERAGESPEPDTPLHRFLGGEDGRKLEKFARDWEEQWMRVNVALLEARSESLFEQVGPDCYELGRQMGYAAFNFYCPHCNQEQQENLLKRDYDVHGEEVHEPVRYSDTTRCVFKPENNEWECRTCERTTEDPIPIHRMLDGVLFPAYDHLMQENKNERLRIHSKARDQERDLQEKAESELDGIRRKHMSEIFSLSEEMERFQADIAGEHEAIESMQDLLDEYQMAQDESITKIKRFTQEVHNEVQNRTEQVLNKVDTVKEREMEALEEELDELSKAKRLEDERRDALLGEIAEHNRRSAEANERSAAANERSAAADERTAEASEQQVEEQRKTRETVEEVGNELGEKLDEQTAMRRAEQRQLGLDTDDYSSVTHPLRAMKDTKDEMVGTLTGKSKKDIEASKMKNA